MTNEQINIAIAEACLTPGTFRTFGFGCDGRDMGELRGWWKNQESNRRSDFVTEIPDYCNDLNAMHEAEETLQGMQRAECAVILNRVAGRDWPNGIGAGCFAHIHATARQRAEAFLRTIGKWEEAQ